MYWSNKKVLVTGGAGFIGSRVVDLLHKKGAKIRVVDNLSKGEASNLHHLVNDIEFIQDDLLNPSVAEKSMKDIDVCFHFAARIGGIGYFHKYPATSVRDNAIMNLNMWDAARETKPKMICISSSMVFERTEIFPTPEKAIILSPPPLTGYGFSKLVAEYIATTYNEEFDIPFVITRPFNAYGPGEVPGDYIGYAHVIPDLFMKIKQGQNPVEILGKGNQSRSYTFVDDTADGIIYLAENEKALNNDFNIATGVETNVMELANAIWKIVGKKEPIKFKHLPSFKYDVQRRVPDVTKITGIGWKPKYTLEHGLKLTIDWLEKRK
jgi:UDP-glucose 4-epimerase